MIRKFRFISFLCLLLGFQLKAQVYDFKTINQENGLPSSVITAITQDSRDLMWIGTDGAGLVKYDGKSFFTYDQSNGLEGTFITDIVEDANKNLVISTKYNGIYVFDGHKFFRQISQFQNEIDNNTVDHLLSSPEGTYGISGHELVLITNDYKVKKLSAEKVEYIEPNSLVKDGDDIYIGAANGLFKYSKGEISPFPVPNDFAYTYITRNNNKLMVSTFSGNIYTIVNSSFEKVLSLPENLRFNIRQFFVASSGNIWIAGDNNQGLYLYNGLNYIHFNDKNGFTGENISCFYQGRNKELYIGTTGTGMFESGPQLFFSYNNVPHLNNSLIFSILLDKDRLYAGIRHSGIASYIINTDGSYTLEKKFEEKLNANAFLKNDKGEILAGCSEGLFVIENGKLKKINGIFADEHNINIKAMAQDDNGNYLIGTLDGGLLVLDRNFKLFRELSSRGDGGFTNSVLTINKKDNNTWYIGANTGLFELKTDKLRYEITDQIIPDVIGVSTFDSYGNFWCTGANCVYSVNNKKVKKFTKKNGLTSTLIYTLTADQNGFVWSGHNLGLDKIEVNKSGNIKSIKNYNSFNGFKGLETNMRSQFTDDDGNFYVGTVKGLVSCNTAMTIEQIAIPRLVFTNLKIFNKNLDWRTIKKQNKWFNMPEKGHVFSSDENQLTFEFALVNTSNSNNYLYTYKLKGLDKNWSSPSVQNEVTYSNLSYGEYEFVVQLIGKEGGMPPNIVAFKFSIATPFYYTWWFILLVILFTGILIVLLFNRSMTYNKEFVKDYSEVHSKQEEMKIYFLFFGIVAPLTEIVVYLFELRRVDELVPNIAIGLFCLSIYFLSDKFKLIKKYLYFLFFSVIFLYALSTAYKIYTQPFELITFSEFFIILFFTHSLFHNRKHYWLFTGALLVFILSLFYNDNVPIKTVVVFINGVFISIFIYEIRYISQLNSKARLLFADTIVNKGSSLVIAGNKDGNITFISRNVKDILGYEVEDMLGDGWWKNTTEKNEDVDNQKQKILTDIKAEGTSLRRIKTKWGTYKWIQWNDKRFGNETVVGIGQDVTERIHAQNQYRNLIQTATDIIYESNKYGDIVFINKFAEKLLGYPTTEMIFKHYSDFVREDFKPMLEKFYLSADKDTKVFEAVEFPLVKKNGEEVWVSQKVSIKRDDNGDLVGYSGIIRDISKIKAIELAIKESENNFRQINETIQDVFWLYDIRQNKLDYISPSSLEVLGVTQQEYYDDHALWKKFILDEDKALVLKAHEIIETKGYYEIEYRIHKGNEIRWIYEKSFGIKNAEGVVIKNSGICSDITDKKLAEDKLRESENNFRQLNETIDDVFWLYDILNQKYIYISPSCKRVLGITSEDIYSGQSMKTVVYKDDLQMVIDANIAVDSGIDYEIEYRIIVDGQIRWIAEKSFAIRNADGKVVRNSGICADITERILNQQKIDSQAKIVKQYSKELEFHNTIKERLILCKTIEEISLNTLGFIKSNLSNCEHIALLLFENEKSRLKGYYLQKDRLINEEINIANIKSFEKCRKGEIFIESDLKASSDISVSDEANIDSGIRSYIVFPLNYAGEMIATLSIGFSTPFELTEQEIKNIKDATEIISITINQMKLRNKLELYSKDLEFQNVIKQKLINASSIENIAKDALNYVVEETKGCVTVSVNMLDERKAYLEGYKCLKGELIAETWRWGNDLKCYPSIMNKVYYIEYDLFKADEKSYSDSLYLDKGERSYIVLPILDNNELVGTLSLGFESPFQLSKWEINRLEEVTFILSIALKQVKLNNAILEKNTDITSSINYAKDIQDSILPDLKSMKGTFKNVALLYRPKDIVSGDFYGAIELESYTYLYAADCTGHGVPGAFITLLGNMIIEQLIRNKIMLKPAEILTKLDEQIYTILNHRKDDIIRDGMEIAFCMVDRKANTLTFAGAAMGLLYYIGEEEFYIKGQRRSIGENRQDEFEFTNEEIKLTGKEQFYMATDGYQDQLGGANYKRFSKNELMKLLREIKFKDSVKQEEILNNTLDKYIGKHKQIDDITILGFTINTK